MQKCCCSIWVCFFLLGFYRSGNGWSPLNQTQRNATSVLHEFSVWIMFLSRRNCLLSLKFFSSFTSTRRKWWDDDIIQSHRLYIQLYSVCNVYTLYTSHMMNKYKFGNSALTFYDIYITVPPHRRVARTAVTILSYRRRYINSECKYFVYDTILAKHIAHHKNWIQIYLFTQRCGSVLNSFCCYVLIVSLFLAIQFCVILSLGRWQTNDGWIYYYLIFAYLVGRSVCGWTIDSGHDAIIFNCLRSNGIENLLLFNIHPSTQ